LGFRQVPSPVGDVPNVRPAEHCDAVGVGAQVQASGPRPGAPECGCRETHAARKGP
jgi:hypothetical protein